MGRRVGVTHSFAVCDEETGMIIDGKGINPFMSRTELVSQVSEWVESIVADSP